MINKKLAGFMTGLCCTAFILGGCSTNKTENNNSSNQVNEESNSNQTVVEDSLEEETTTEPIMINYSFLYDDDTREEIGRIMKEDGVAQEQIDEFMRITTQFSDILGEMKGANTGFTTTDASEVFYDYEYIGSTLDRELGFDDQNCRLTAYTLFHQFYTVDEDSTFVYSDDSLYGDLEILKGNQNLSFSEEDMRKYTTLFFDVSVPETKNMDELAQTVKETWADRGITFNYEERVQLATIMIHDPQRNTVFAGHAGVVFQTETGYLLVEKLSQYTQFVAVKFDNYDDLNTYMLSEVAGFHQEGAAESFIMLDDQLLTGRE